MPIPQLEYAPLSQNHRVTGFEVPGDEQPWIYTTDNLLTASEMDALILVAYRQIYNEQQMLEHHRQRFLESQLRAGQITVREFIQGLALSDSFQRLVYESNNNYRFVEICVQRILGRNVYSDREKLAWSIVLAQKGLRGFIADLVDSAEYLNNFGDNTVPYQRRRILPQRSQGEITFAHMARYGADYRNKLPQPSLASQQGAANLAYLRWDWQKNPPQAIGQIGKTLVVAGASFVLLLILAVLLGF